MYRFICLLCLSSWIPGVKGVQVEEIYDLTKPIKGYVQSDQFRISPTRSITRNITSHSMKNLAFHSLCTCHRLAPGVDHRADHGDCKMHGAKLTVSPRAGVNFLRQSPLVKFFSAKNPRHIPLIGPANNNFVPKMISETQFLCVHVCDKLDSFHENNNSSIYAHVWARTF